MLPGTKMLLKLIRIMSEREDKSFDKKFGCDFSGVIGAKDLKTDSEFRDNATSYHAAWCSSIRKLIKKSASLKIRPETFIDIGCGKGKVCFYAAAIKRFKKIIGIDFDSELIAQANEYKSKFSEYNIEFLHADATEYDLGQFEQSMIFMFNPFDDKVMRIFLEKNMNAFREKRHVIAYSNDMQHKVIEEMGFKKLWRHPKRKMSLWQL